MTPEFKFVKYHGCGNDFVIRDELSGERTDDRTRSRLARVLTHRRFQIGADGIIFLESAGGFDGSMRLFEPAGNEADMCGNGIRCVAAYLMEKLGKDEVEILTRDGPKRVVKVGDQYRVDMGKVRTLRADLAEYVADRGKPGDSMLRFSVRALGRTYKGAVVNSGEPHIVVRTRSLEGIDVRAIGDAVNADRRRFPRGVNINFVQVAGPHTISIRTYERGVYDETYACGTGATASAAVSLMLGWVKPGVVSVVTRGGRLRIAVRADGAATMTGPAVPVYEGSLRVRR